MGKNLKNKNGTAKTLAQARAQSNISHYSAENSERSIQNAPATIGKRTQKEVPMTEHPAAPSRTIIRPNTSETATNLALSVAATTTPDVPRAVAHKRVKRVRLHWFLLGSVCGIGISFLLNVAYTGLVVPQMQALEAYLAREPEKPVLAQAAPIAPLPAKPAAPVITYPRTLALTVSQGDTLINMLLRNQVPQQEAHQVVNALKEEFNPSQLRVGQKISLRLNRHERLGDKAAVEELAIRLPLSTIELERAENGFAVQAMKDILETKPYHGVGKVRTSLYQAAADAGIPSAAMAELVRAFSYDVDFQRDIHPGDTIEVLLDRKTTKDGRVGGYGNARYAALTLRGKKHEIFHFTSGAVQGWFDAKGNSVRKSLLRTPINAARISSGYGMRRHPVLGYSRMHRGVDFAAVTGTPILAAGDGVVSFRGWKGGYGNYVAVKHNSTYTTAYGHMSRFHPSVRQGSRVKQGQVIGYVGSTGISTGPHLHYEILQNGAQVNPTAQKFNTSQALAGAELQRFRAKQGAVKQEIVALRSPQPVAAITTASANAAN